MTKAPYIVARHGKVSFETAAITCEPSAYLFGQVLAFLRVNGYHVSEQRAGADVYLMNTCCVTRHMSEGCEKRIQSIWASKRPKKMVVFGCLARTTRTLMENQQIVLIGPKETHRFNHLFPHTISMGGAVQPTIDEALFRPCQSHITNRNYYVQICQGCMNRCAYCNIKNAKGDVVSKDEGSILSEIEKGLADGVREFTLLADDCGSYGIDRGTDIASLVEKITALDDELRLKFNYFFPGRFMALYSRFREVLKSDRIAYINLPIQSGASRILKLMNRECSVQAFSDIIKDLRSISPRTWLYTHILINFPTETREEFGESLHMSRLFDERMIISYADNPGTPADDITPKVSYDEQVYRLKASEAFLKAGNLKGFVVKTGDSKIWSPLSPPNLFGSCFSEAATDTAREMIPADIATAGGGDVGGTGF